MTRNSEADGERLELGSDAAPFVVASLSAGRALSKACLARDFGSGNFYTYLPSGHTGPIPALDAALPLPERIELGLDSGVRMHRKVHIGEGALVAAVREHLESSPDAICLVEDQLRRPNDPDAGGRLVVVGADTVVHVLSRPTSTSDLAADIVVSLRRASSYLLTVLLTTRPSPNGSDVGPFIGDDEIRHLVSRASAVVVSAFDGEGYVFHDFGTRNGPSSRVAGGR